MAIRTRTRYKHFKDGGRVLHDGSVAGTTTPVEVQDSPDEASHAFKGQIDALRKSEEIQHQRQALAAQHGLTPNQAAFLHHNPSFPNHPEVAKRALMAAHEAGHAEDSDAFHAHVHRAFHAEIGTAHSDTLVERGGLRPDDDGKPVKPKRKPVDDDDEPSTPNRFYSAPVSRETSANGYGGAYGDRPGRVTLSVAQKEAARMSGISEKEYGLQVLELRKRKANGDYGGSP